MSGFSVVMLCILVFIAGYYCGEDYACDRMRELLEESRELFEKLLQEDEDNEREEKQEN